MSTLEYSSINTDEVAEQSIDTLTLFGFPGAGKGTFIKHAQNFLAEHEVESAHFEMSRYLKQDPAFLRQVQSYISKGELVPDELTIGKIHEGLTSLDPKKRWFLDGIIRTPAQVKVALDIMELLDRSHKVVHLQLSPDLHEAKDIARDRARIRREEALTAGVRPRDDDDPEVVERRLQIGEVLYDAILPALDEKDLVITLDASKSIEEVQAESRGLLLACLNTSDLQSRR